MTPNTQNGFFAYTRPPQPSEEYLLVKQLLLSTANMAHESVYPDSHAQAPATQNLQNTWVQINCIVDWSVLFPLSLFIAFSYQQMPQDL